MFSFIKRLMPTTFSYSDENALSEDEDEPLASTDPQFWPVIIRRAIKNWKILHRQPGIEGLLQRFDHDKQEYRVTQYDQPSRVISAELDSRDLLDLLN